MERNLPNLLNNLDANWHDILLKLDQLEKISNALQLRAKELDPLPIYPAPQNTFRAFSFCSPEDVKVVIIGQDCYHGPNQAIGLCFGVDQNMPCPPSLRNIKRELKQDVGKELLDQSLVKWASQGVWLLNAALTVHHSQAGSHLKIWSDYTDSIIKDFSEWADGVVFLLWGNFAKAKANLISQERGHLILTANHPSPLSANRGGWFGSKHFSQTNEYLTNIGKTPIDW